MRRAKTFRLVKPWKQILEQNDEEEEEEGGRKVIFAFFVTELD